MLARSLWLVRRERKMLALRQRGSFWKKGCSYQNPTAKKKPAQKKPTREEKKPAA
jgi:hypothetical protein